jgi:ketosteroid isomerase-like protein
MSLNESNAELARRGYEAVLRGDFDLIAGDRVVVILRPVSETGEPVEPVANLTTFRDGKVVGMVHYSDPGDAFVAAGRQPPD